MSLIMGLDPGMAITGFGILEVQGNTYRPIVYDCVRTPPNTSQATRLDRLYSELSKIIKKYQPREVAVEQLFIHRNASTAILVGQARGVALLAAVRNGAQVAEYSPLQVKMGITGSGRAPKTQVQYMVRMILNLHETPRPADVADALAVAVCHCHNRRVEALYD